MKALLQRVRSASVSIEGQCVGRIGPGLLVLVGIGAEDTSGTGERLLEKIVNLRIFRDGEKHFHRSVLEIQGALLVISQFTLYADCRKGRRPSFALAAPPDTAREIYQQFVEKARTYPLQVEQGEFGALMDVELCNEGPVTISLDSQELR